MFRFLRSLFSRNQKVRTTYFKNHVVRLMKKGDRYCVFVDDNCVRSSISTNISLSYGIYEHAVEHPECYIEEPLVVLKEVIINPKT